MKIRAQFFAQLRDLAGVPELTVELPEKASVADLLAEIYEKRPLLRAHDARIQVGVGVEFVDRDYKLQPSDDISIMPPVQGG